MPGNRIATYPALIADEAAFNALPLQVFPPPWWTDISARALGPWGTSHGSNYQLARTMAGILRPVYDNRDGGLDPDNSAGPYWPNAQPYRGLRKRMRFGPNLLTADQASAGEFSSLLGPMPLPDLNVINDGGYPLSIVASGSAFQGAQVYQATLPNGATTFATVLLLQAAQVVPRQSYSFQAQARITSGNSVSTQVAVLWYDNLGNALGTTTGTAQTLTSGAGTWTQLTASGQAPAGAFSAWLKVQIASGTLSGGTVWQVDGLQWEASQVASPWQMPGTLGANLLPQAVATGTGSIDPTKDSAGAYFASAAGSVAQATNLTAAPTGATTAVAWTTPSGTTSASPLYAGVVGAGAPALDGPVADCTQVAAGSVYTFSVYLSRASSADATVQVTAAIKWFDSTGALISTSSGSAVTVAAGSWVRASVANATAPAGAVWGRVRFLISAPASTTATNVLYATGWQLEQAASASAWSDPGPTWFAWSGFFEQFPMSWRLSGTYGELDAVGVDALAGLAQYTVLDPLAEEMLGYNPNFLYTLGDPVGSSSCADLSGNRIAAPIENSPFGAGSLVLGSSITAPSSSGLMVGSTGTVATFNNNSSQANAQEPQTYISLHKTTTAPGPPTSGAWSRLIAFRSPTTPAAGHSPTIWSGVTPTYSTDLSQFQLSINATTGTLSFLENGAATLAGILYTSASTVCDGNWHLFGVVFEGNGYFDIYLDGARVLHDNNGGAGWVTTTNLQTDVIGAFIVPGNNAWVLGFVGDVAFAAEFPTALSTAQMTNLYNSFRTASSGESTGARANRLLTWIGWNGARAIDTGQTASMGPATDLTGRSGLDGLNAIADTENGDVFASNGGALTFKARTARYNSAPQFVFGSNTQWGEWPYRAGDGDLQLPTDPTNTYNIIPTQQYSPAQTSIARDAASQTANFPRTLPARTINSTSFAEVQAAGQYLLSQLKTPRKRLAQMVLDVSAVPGLWRVAAQLEKGTRIRVMARPAWRSTAIQFDGFVEYTAWNGDPRSGGATTLTVQASPADPNNYWTLGALHTTLNAQAASGQAQATINALPDAAVNMLSQSLPAGYQLTFEPGTPRQETMTLTPTGIPATTIGYQTATLTFTANFAFTHAADTVVCEPLPAGYTDPTVWDANSVIGAASATVVSGGASGTNTITVGPLADAAVNPLGSNWNVGDLLSISPGTVNAEGYNLLTPNQSTAGEGVLPLAAGTNGTAVGVSSALGTASVTASGTAFQGANVWQVPIAANASLSRLLRVGLVPVAGGLAHTWSVYVRSVTSGQNPTVNAQIIFFDRTGTQVGSTANGSTSVLTGGASASWTRVSVTATAPATAVWATVGVPLNATAPTSTWNFQADGLQFEQAASASVYCTTPQVKSVAASVPGYSSVQITLNTNLVNSHAAGDTVCDWLPPGISSPPAGTARLSY